MTKSEKEKYELIEKFIENKLSKEEKEKFEFDMENNPAFAQEVHAHIEVHELVLDQGILDIKEQLQKIHKKESGGNNGNYTLYSALAGVLLIGGLIAYLYQSPKTKETKATNHSTKIDSKGTQNSAPDMPMELTTKEGNKNTVAPLNKKSPIAIDGVANNDTPVITNRPDTTNQTVQPKVSNAPKADTSITKSNPNDKKSTPSKIDCATINITGSATPRETCKDENNGSININLSSLKGGKQPYKYSLDNETEDFITTSLFNNLSAGTYTIYVKDANGCINSLTKVEVINKDCQKNDLLVSPYDNIECTFSLKANIDGKILIYNRAGANVHTIYFSNGYPSTWNGTDNSGQLLQGGYYSYIINYNDQSVTQGNITIKR